MLDNPLYNPNGFFTNARGMQALDNTWLSLGEIVNLTSDGEYQSHLIQRYDVLIHNTNGHIATGCIPITSSFTGNGVGEYATYKVGDAVIVSCLYNHLDHIVILGAVSLPGNMDKLMGANTERTKFRQLQEDNTYAPQPILSSDRVQNPSANRVTVTSTQLDTDAYRLTDLLTSSTNRADLVREQALPTGIDIDTGLGDKGSYYRGIKYDYVNGSYYQIALADKEDKCTKATRVAAVALDAVNKLSKITSYPRNSNSLIDAQYRAAQHRKIHELALKTAKQCNKTSFAQKQAVKSLDTKKEAAPTSSAYKPKELRLPVTNSKPRLTLTREEVLAFISYLQWNNRLSKQQEDTAIRLMYIYYDLPEATQVNQSLVDKILGDSRYVDYKRSINK